MTDADSPDVIDRVAGLSPGSALARLRRERPDIVRYSEGAYAALLEPRDPGGVSRAERLAIALKIATINEDAALAAHYRGELASAGAAVTEDARWAAILRHVERVTGAPGTATRAHLDELAAHGLSPRDIVTISQLIALVNYQVRVLAGLRFLQGAGQ
jgi:uncharacterized protein YciW